MCAPKHFRHPVHSCQRFWNKQVGRHVSDSVGPSSIIKEGRYLCATLCAEGGLLTPHWVSVLSRLISVIIFIGAFERGERAERKCVCKPITFKGVFRPRVQRLHCIPLDSLRSFQHEENEIFCHFRLERTDMRGQPLLNHRGSPQRVKIRQE